MRPTFGEISGRGKRFQEQAIDGGVSRRFQLKGREIDSGIPLCQQIEISLEGSDGSRGKTYTKSV